MKKHSFIVILVFLLLLSFIRCNQEENPIFSPIDTNVIKSLKVGNQWSYVTTQFDSLGKEISAYTITFTIVRDTLIQGEKWFIINNGTDEHQLFTNKEDGLWKWLDYHIEPGLEAKYPVNINDSWTDLDNLIRRCTAKDVIVKFQTREYKCVQYSILSKEGDILVNYYYTPGLGNLLGEGYIKGSNQKYYVSYKRQLIDARIN